MPKTDKQRQKKLRDCLVFLLICSKCCIKKTSHGPSFLSGQIKTLDLHGPSFLSGCPAKTKTLVLHTARASCRDVRPNQSPTPSWAELLLEDVRPIQNPTLIPTTQPNPYPHLTPRKCFRNTHTSTLVPFTLTNL